MYSLLFAFRTAVATFYVVAVLGTAAGGVPLLW